MRQWVHNKEEVTLEDAQERLGRQLPAKVLLYRHLEKDGFTLISIKELRIEFHESSTDYVTEVQDSAGQATQNTKWSTLVEAVEWYNKI